MLLRFTCHTSSTPAPLLIDALIIIIEANDKHGVVWKALQYGVPGPCFRGPNIEALKYLEVHAMTGFPPQAGKNYLTFIIIQFLSAELLVAVAKLFHGFSFTRQVKGDFSYRSALTFLGNEEKILADFLKSQKVGTIFAI